VICAAHQILFGLITWVGHVAHTGQTEMHAEFWRGNLKRSLDRSRLRWEDNIKMELTK
jgi:hypothetical protein